MEVNVSHDHLNSLIKELQRGPFGVSRRTKMSEILQYALNQDYLVNVKRATKLIKQLRTDNKTLDLVQKAKCIMFLEEIKVKTVEQNCLEVERCKKVEKEIEIMNNHLHRCGMRGHTIPFNGGPRRIYVHDLEKFRSKFVEDSEHVISSSETNTFHYHFDVDNWPYMITLQVEKSGGFMEC